MKSLRAETLVCRVAYAKGARSGARASGGRFRLRGGILFEAGRGKSRLVSGHFSRFSLQPLDREAIATYNFPSGPVTYVFIFLVITAGPRAQPKPNR